MKKSHIKISSMLKAMSHPKRIEILQIVLNENETNVNELSKLINAKQPSTSQYLKTLKYAGILKSEIKHVERIYSFKGEKEKQFVNKVLNPTV